MSKDGKFYQWKCGKEWTKKIDINKLYNFWVKWYQPLKRKEKEALSSYMKYNDIEHINFEPDIKEIVQWYQSELMSMRAKNGHANYISKTTKAERDLTQQKRAEKTKVGRIKKILDVNPNLTYEEAWYQSFINGLIQKGKNAAELLGLEPNQISETELLKLSGLHKKINHAKLADVERKQYQLTWKKSNLKNNNVRNIIIREYPEFDVISIDDELESSIEKWYSTYASIMSSTRIENGKNHYSHCKSGHYYSMKNERRFYYRSSYELLVCEYLEDIKEVYSYSMESFCIKYKRKGESFERRYRPDFIVNMNGKQILLEVKPEFQVDEFIKNKAQYISDNIIIITENHIESKENFYEYITTNRNI